jgi:hypothetical protein
MGHRKNITLPQMRCDRDCGQCCKVVIVTTAELNRAKQYAESCGIKPKRQGGRCPWYQKGQCAVHSVRPLICQLYGHLDVPEMICPRGYNVNLSQRDGAKMVAKCGTPTTTLHHVFNDWEQLIRGHLGAPHGYRVTINPGRQRTGR